MPDRLTEIKARLAAATEKEGYLLEPYYQDVSYLLRLVEAGNQLAMSASEVRCGHRDQCDCSLCEDLNTYEAAREGEAR